MVDGDGQIHDAQDDKNIGLQGGHQEFQKVKGRAVSGAATLPR